MAAGWDLSAKITRFDFYLLLLTYCDRTYLTHIDFLRYNVTTVGHPAYYTIHLITDILIAHFIALLL